MLSTKNAVCRAILTKRNHQENGRKYAFAFARRMEEDENRRPSPPRPLWRENRVFQNHPRAGSTARILPRPGVGEEAPAPAKTAGGIAFSAWPPAQARPSPRGQKAAREGMFPPGRKWYQTSRGSGRRRVRQAAFPRGATARRLVSGSPEPSGIRCRCGPRWGRRGCRFRSRPPWERPSRPPSCRRRRRGPGPCPAACRVRPGLHP